MDCFNRNNFVPGNYIILTIIEVFRKSHIIQMNITLFHPSFEFVKKNHYKLSDDDMQRFYEKKNFQLISDVLLSYHNKSFDHHYIRGLFLALKRYLFHLSS